MIACFVLGCAALMAAPSLKAQTYTVTDLGTLGGINSVAWAINNAGQVVGSSDTASGDQHAFLWDAANGMIDLGVPSGWDASIAYSMGYHDAREIPNYWSYAHNFVLQDHLFEPNASWSLPCHLFLVSEWSAVCSIEGDPYSCVNALENPGLVNHAWTDLTFLLHRNQVSWGYYVTEGLTPDSDDGGADFNPHPQSAKTPDIWNPLPAFTIVKQDGQLGNIKPLTDFYVAVKNGTLPQVVWIVPDAVHSEHPEGKISDGQAHVTNIVNAIMNSPYWNSTAIFVSWDDWGGFYDHVRPFRVDKNGYGLRVPGLVISPYAKSGYIDKQVLSFDAYAKFIEDLFMNGQRLNPSTDFRPDPRPTVRDALPQLGDLMNDFDFTQTPLPPLVLQPYPKRR